MALNYLTIEEMVESTQDWVAPETPIRTAFEQQPMLAALIPTIEDAHAGLLAGQRAILVHHLDVLGQRRLRVDARHDDQARGIHSILEGHIFLAQADNDNDRVRTLSEARDFLFPDGLTVVNLSYRQEAGHASLLSSRMTTDMESYLAAISAPGGTLLDSVRAWLAAGDELGELEDEYADTQVPSKRASLRRARHDWMKMIQAVRTVAALNSNSDAHIEAALNRIVVIEKAAAQRLRDQGMLDDDQLGDEPPTDGEVIDDEPAVPADPDAPTTGEDDGQPVPSALEASAD